MSGLGTLSGMSGLTKLMNTPEDSQRELNTLSALEGHLDKKKKEGMAMQEMEANEYEEIRKEASTLLGRDRIALNKKALELQKNVAEEIKSFGSRKKYFENGGVSQLKSYKNELLGSEEFLRSKDNKVNMERLLSIPSNQRHLIAEKDQKALRDYEAGNGDTITYSGLLTDLDFSIEDLMPLGEKVPPMTLLNDKDNRTRLYANYTTEYGADSLAGLSPDAIDQELLNYMDRKRYSVIGKNDFWIKQKAEQERQNRERQSRYAAKEGTKEKSAPILFTNEINQYVTDNFQKQKLGIQDLVGGQNWFTKNKTNGALTALGFGNSSSEWNESSKKTVSASNGILDGFGRTFDGKRFKPASAVKVKFDNTVLSKLSDSSGWAPNEDGTVNYKLDQQTYNATGALMNADDVDDDFWRGGGFSIDGQAKILGSFVGWKTADGSLITDVVDSKGQIQKGKDGKPINQNYEAYEKSGGVEHSMFIAYDIEGQTVYREVGMKNVLEANTINAALGQLNDISETIKVSNASEQRSQVAQKEMSKDPEAFQKQIDLSAKAPNSFGSKEYGYEADNYRTSDGKNRDKETKAYYMAYDAMTNGKGSFDAKTLEKSGIAKNKMLFSSLDQGTLRDDIMNYEEYGGSNFISRYAEVQNSDMGENPKGKAENDKFFSLWKTYFDFLNNKK